MHFEIFHSRIRRPFPRVPAENKIHPRGNPATFRPIPAGNPRDSHHPHPRAHLYHRVAGNTVSPIYGMWFPVAVMLNCYMIFTLLNFNSQLKSNKWVTIKQYTNPPAAVVERSCHDDEDPSFPRLPLLEGSRVVELARTPVPLFALLRSSSTAPAACVPPSSLLVSSGRSSARLAVDDGDVGCCSRYSKSSTESDVGCLSLLPVHRLMSSQPRVRDRVDDNKEDWTAVDPFNTSSSWPGNAATAYTSIITAQCVPRWPKHR